MKRFAIFNNVTVMFGLMDRIRILFGKSVSIEVKTYVDAEVSIEDGGETISSVDTFFLPKVIASERAEAVYTEEEEEPVDWENAVETGEQAIRQETLTVLNT